MKPLFLAGLFLALTLLACNQHPAPAASASSGVSDSLAAHAMGTYTGRFGKSLITVVINYISGKTVSGYDIHKGLRRNFNGEVTPRGGLLNFVLREPGDNGYDGVFSFSLDTASWKIKGKWTPVDSSKLKPRDITLARKQAQESMNEDFDIYYVTWLAGNSTDSVLRFDQNGSCRFEFYPSGDSTSQLITVRGNYEGDSKGPFRIEWEKNDYLKPTSMKLVLDSVKQVNTSDSTTYYSMILRGNGWVFTMMEGD